MLFSYSSSLLKYKLSSISSQYMYFKILDFLIFPYVNNIFLYLNLAPQCGRPHNNGLYRTRLDRVSATNLLLCLVTTKIFLLAAAPTAAYNQLTCRFLYYYTYGRAFANSRKQSFRLLTMV